MEMLQRKMCLEWKDTGVMDIEILDPFCMLLLLFIWKHCVLLYTSNYGIYFEASQDGKLFNVGPSQTSKGNKCRVLTEQGLQLEPLCEEVVIFIFVYSSSSLLFMIYR